jgi:hypothetical protein
MVVDSIVVAFVMCQLSQGALVKSKGRCGKGVGQNKQNRLQAGDTQACI